MSLTSLGTPIMPGMVSALPVPALTSAHRALIARIQDKCLDITLGHPELVADCAYSGNTHELCVRLIPRAHLGTERGGDGSFRGQEVAHIYLPGIPQRAPAIDTTAVLADTLNQLEAVLPVPGGAA
ncbi:hypothetical protein [Halomonas sp. SL1]|uniref:hypothetical protein n=1 Tax=Halomonas sp. SL1 TaxID=2137478 RepID=UPI000D16A712|nr:hypothetical protein [Halomonas sp. SL1]RAH37434.1 hypothetical protein C9J49_011065 [Halomonas sp. SL1]